MWVWENVGRNTGWKRKLGMKYWRTFHGRLKRVWEALLSKHSEQENLGWLQEGRTDRSMWSHTCDMIVFRHPGPAEVAGKRLAMVTIRTL